MRMSSRSTRLLICDMAKGLDDLLYTRIKTSNPDVKTIWRCAKVAQCSQDDVAPAQDRHSR